MCPKIYQMLPLSLSWCSSLIMIRKTHQIERNDVINISSQNTAKLEQKCHILNRCLFNLVQQVNEETSNRRPIMLTFPPEETVPPPKKEQKEENNSQSATTPSLPPAMDTEMESPSTSEKTKPTLVVTGLNSSQVSEVIR